MRIPCVCVVALLSAVSSAQTTHIVGPGGFAQVNDALAVAAPGDEIVVQPGTYQRFTATFDVTIRAVTPDTVTIGGVFPLATYSEVFLGPGECVRLVDMTVTGVYGTGGTIVLDRCVVTLFLFGGGVRVADCMLVLQGCRLTGGNGTSATYQAAGLHATNATVTAIDCDIRGTDAGGFEGPAPGYGIYLNNADLHGSRLTVLGGEGVAFVYPAAEALKAIGSSHVWVSDSSFTNGTPCPVAAAFGRLGRCTLIPNCTVGIPTTGPLLGLHRPTPMTSPGAVWLDFSTDGANEPIGVYLSTGVGVATIPLLEQPILLDVANAVPFALVVADATGHATAACTIPAGFSGLEFWFQGIRGATWPLQLSPVSGGVVRGPAGPLSITRVDPLSSAAGAGITVTGVGFLPGLTVAVNGIPISPTSVAFDRVVFPFPAGLACDSQVSLTNPDGQIANASINPTPVIGTVAGSGSAAGNQLFALQGSGFSPGTTVTIGGAAATVVSVLPSVVVVRTPPGVPGPAAVLVTTPGGCAATTTYTYL